jgi:hypothetical protein
MVKVPITANSEAWPKREEAPLARTGNHDFGRSRRASSTESSCGFGCRSVGYLLAAAQVGRYLAEYSPARDAAADDPTEARWVRVEGLSRWSVTASRPALLTS